MTTQSTIKDYVVNSSGDSEIRRQYLDLTGRELLSSEGIVSHLEAKQASFKANRCDRAEYEVSQTETLSKRPEFIVLNDGHFDEVDIDA